MNVIACYHCLLCLFMSFFFTMRISFSKIRPRSTVRLLASSSSSSTFSSSIIKVFYNDVFEVSLPSHHRFPMSKYRNVRTKLQKEMVPRHARVVFEESPLATMDELASTHCPNYIQRFLSGDMTEKEIRAVGFPWSQQNIKRSLSSVGGTVAATRHVLNSSRAKQEQAARARAQASAVVSANDEEEKEKEEQKTAVAAHVAGGTHHAFYDRGEGFCVFSDIAVAANLALAEYEDIVKKVLIIDLDVHQGNGNAALFAKDTRVFTFSMHCTDNYFSAKEVSDIDLELAAGTSDDEYNNKLAAWLPFLLDIVQPNMVFFQAGVDIFERDRLGKLKVTRQGLQKRNALVYNAIKQRAASNPLALVVTMGGGYPLDNDEQSLHYKELIEVHADVYRQLVDSFG